MGTLHKQLVARGELQLLGRFVIRCAGAIALTGCADGYGKGVALRDGILGSLIVEDVVLAAARCGQQQGWHQQGCGQRLQNILSVHCSSTFLMVHYSKGSELTSNMGGAAVSSLHSVPIVAPTLACSSWFVTCSSTTSEVGRTYVRLVFLIRFVFLVLCLTKKFSH